MLFLSIDRAHRHALQQLPHHTPQCTCTGCPHSLLLLLLCSCMCAWLLHCVRRWGCKLSPKLFVARKFVVKHIRSKQEDKLQEEKEKVGG